MTLASTSLKLVKNKNQKKKKKKKGTKRAVGNRFSISNEEIKKKNLEKKKEKLVRGKYVDKINKPNDPQIYI